MTDDLSNVNVKDVMVKDVVTVHEDDSIEKLFDLFEKYHYNSYPVLNNEAKLVGLIDQDIILETLMFDRSPRIKHTHEAAIRSLSDNAKGIMIPHPVTISSEANLHDVADLMLKHRVNRVCVVKDDRLVGIVSKRDIINEVYKSKKG
ncbi:MAG: CBS domain-containing protein [Methanosarcinales archaeon]|nr:CBS domain-containing protein [Methanosarcinales archaeon]